METSQGLNVGPRASVRSPTNSRLFIQSVGIGTHYAPEQRRPQTRHQSSTRTPTASLIGLEQLQEEPRLNEQDEIERLLAGINAVLNRRRVSLCA